MTDPRDFDRRMELERATDAPTPWWWIAGALLVIAILALVFTGGEPIRTTGTDTSPPATTGMAPKPASPGAPSPTGT